LGKGERVLDRTGPNVLDQSLLLQMEVERLVGVENLCENNK